MSWQKFNPNPCGRSLGDCAVRAISAALEVPWDKAYDALCTEGYSRCDMPSADETWSAVLKKNGFGGPYLTRVRTAQEFCELHPRGVYVLAFGGHVATVRDGEIWDSWNSENERPIYFYSRR